MSVDPAGIDAEGYCEVQDVINFFDRFAGDDVEDIPADRIQRAISSNSEKIDTYTSHAFRERRVEGEFKDLDNVYRINSGMPIFLQKRDIRTPLDSEKGDAVQLWEGGSYTDLVAEDQYTEGRDGDYWIEESTGTLHLYRRSIVFSRYRQLKVNYRYGKETVPADINQICAKLTAADLMETDFYRYTTPGNEEAPDASQVAETFREQAEKELERHKEIRGTGLF